MHKLTNTREHDIMDTEFTDPLLTAILEVLLSINSHLEEQNALLGSKQDDGK